MTKKTAKKTVKKKTTAKEQKTHVEPQPEINIGMIGHVDHGKTTLVQALSGKWTDTHSEEIKRGITIRLGYADVTFYKCSKCKGAEAWGVTQKCHCGEEAKPIRKVSLVDAPGHESLMATMLCGANIMDGAVLLISATEKCPQPQTQEHLQALQITGLENLIVIQNKIDLVSEEAAKKNYKEIKAFLKKTKYENAPIIPMAAKHGINMDILIETIQKEFKTPTRHPKAELRFNIARSFDINRPGIKPEKMTGGVLGGCIKQGELKEKEEIEILPGYQVEEKNQQVWKPLRTKIISIITGGEKVKKAHPGGNLAIMTTLDPSVVKSDQLVGAVAGLPGKLPRVWNSLSLETHLLERVVGSKDALVVEPIKMKEIIMLNVNAAATVGVITELSKNSVKCTLKRPVCAEKDARVTLSRRVGQRWRLIGYGIIKE